MVELNETTIAMGFAVLGVIGSVIWIALAIYGITILRDIRDGLGDDQSS